MITHHCYSTELPVAIHRGYRTVSQQFKIYDTWLLNDWATAFCGAPNQPTTATARHLLSLCTRLEAFLTYLTGQLHPWKTDSAMKIVASFSIPPYSLRVPATFIKTVQKNCAQKKIFSQFDTFLVSTSRSSITFPCLLVIFHTMLSVFECCAPGWGSSSKNVSTFKFTDDPALGDQWVTNL